MKAASHAGRKTLLSAIHLYQHPRAGHLSPCRFTPSCSEYAAEAIELHGPVRGTVLAVKRVVRCNPFGGRGFDPVAG